MVIAMISPNRLKVSPKVGALQVGNLFAVSFPYDEAANKIAQNGPRAHWSSGLKAWMMPAHEAERIMETMEAIHTALVASGKDIADDYAPEAWVQWDLVPSILVLDSEPDLGEGEVRKTSQGHVVIERIGEPFLCEGSEPGAKSGMGGNHVRRAWHRRATNNEVLAHYERLADTEDPTPDM